MESETLAQLSERTNREQVAMEELRKQHLVELILPSFEWVVELARDPDFGSYQIIDALRKCRDVIDHAITR